MGDNRHLLAMPNRHWQSICHMKFAQQLVAQPPPKHHELTSMRWWASLGYPKKRKHLSICRAWNQCSFKPLPKQRKAEVRKSFSENWCSLVRPLSALSFSETLGTYPGLLAGMQGVCFGIGLSGGISSVPAHTSWLLRFATFTMTPCGCFSAWASFGRSRSKAEIKYSHISSTSSSPLLPSSMIEYTSWGPCKTSLDGWWRIRLQALNYFAHTFCGKSVQQKRGCQPFGSGVWGA